MQKQKGDKQPAAELGRGQERPRDAIDAAAGNLLDVIPTTIAGVSTLLAYIAQHEQGGNAWPDGYAAEHPKNRCDREHGVRREVKLHQNLATCIAEHSGVNRAQPGGGCCGPLFFACAGLNYFEGGRFRLQQA